MSRERELEDYILQGMAHAIWSHAFIQWATNVEPPPEFPPNSDWTNVTPPTPPGALQAVKEISEGIAKLNGLGGAPMAKIFAATRRYVQPRRSETRATEADQAFQFGEEVAMACLGTLDVPELGQYKLPQMNAMLDDEGDRLSWDEGWTWHPPDDPLPHRNPAARWAHSDVQSLLFDKDEYSVTKAKRWAQDHGFKYGAVDEGRGDFIHLRQFPPQPGHPCRTVEFGHGSGIKARVCSTATRNPAENAMSLRDFAGNVNAEMPYIQPEPSSQGAKGRFGDRKVFIAALWRQLRTAPAFEGMTLDEFKGRLVKANQQRLLELARADMVAAMDPAEVAESQWSGPGGYPSYHFVIDRSAP